MAHRELPEGISIPVTASILDVHINTVRRWIKRGYIRAYRVGPHIIRIPRIEIARLRRHRIEHGIVSTEPRPNYPRV